MFVEGGLTFWRISPILENIPYPIVGGLSMNPVETKTLAEIYLQQGHLKKAYEIFKKLSEEDPSDPEIQIRLYELSERFKSPSPPANVSCFSPAERIAILKEWLANIRKRKGA